MNVLLPQSQTTINSKFQQEVFELFRRIPGLLARYNCQNEGVEKDIVVQRVGDRDLLHEVAVEVNGVFHYARNSE